MLYMYGILLFQSSEEQLVQHIIALKSGIIGMENNFWDWKSRGKVIEFCFQKSV